MPESERARDIVDEKPPLTGRLSDAAPPTGRIGDSELPLVRVALTALNRNADGVPALNRQVYVGRSPDAGTWKVLIVGTGP